MPVNCRCYSGRSHFVGTVLAFVRRRENRKVIRLGVCHVKDPPNQLQLLSKCVTNAYRIRIEEDLFPVRVKRWNLCNLTDGFHVVLL
jgi:hypothetical protein